MNKIQRICIAIIILSLSNLTYSQDTLSQQRDEEWSFKDDSGTGIGVWAGAASGVGFSLRFQGKPSNVAMQATGYIVKSGEEVDGSFGIAGLYPLVNLHSSRYMLYASYGYFSDSNAESRFGVGVIGEWNYYKRLTVNVAIDAFTYFSDDDFLIPLISGGFYIYF